MKLVTKRSVIQNVVARWSRTYADGRYGADKLEILRKLRELDLSTATPEEVNAIIGNDGWTQLFCDECGTDMDIVVQINGDTDDYDDTTKFLCAKCLKAASKLLKEAK